MAKDILKEAIADAKAVREVALANAKAALEEAFTPKLQSMLSAKLSEDLNEEYDEDMDEAYMEDEKDKMDEMMYDEDEADEDMKEMAYDEDADEDMKESDLDEEIDFRLNNQGSTTTVMRLSSAGQVGVMKTNPTAVLDVAGTLSADGIVTANDTTDATNIGSGSLVVKGGLGIAKDTYIGGKLNVANDLNVVGVSTFNSDINVSGNATFEEQVSVNDSLFINASNEFFRIRDGVTSTDQFSVDTDNGNTYINGTLTVNGSTNLENANITNDLNITQNLDVTGVSTFKDKVHLLDNQILHFGGAVGDNGDLQIVHDGSNSFIKDVGDGALKITTNGTGIDLMNDSQTDNLAKFIVGSTAALYFDGNEKFITSNTGATITGTLISDGLTMSDSDKITLGTGTDFEQYHDGNNQTILEALNGSIKLRSDTNVSIEDSSGGDLLKADTDAGVELYWRGGTNNGVKFETTQTGGKLTGTLVTDGLKLGDGEIAAFGNSDDLQIYHSGNHSYVSDTGTGQLRLLSNDLRIRNAADNASMAIFNEGGSVELRFNNNTKLLLFDFLSKIYLSQI